MNEEIYNNLEINIADSNGNLRNIDEIIIELEKLIVERPHAMSEHILYLQGEQNMLKKIIKYLKVI